MLYLLWRVIFLLDFTLEEYKTTIFIRKNNFLI